MKTGGRKPIHLGGSMVNGVKTPQRLSVKEAMRPIQDEILEYEHNAGLQPNGQRAQWAVAVLHEVGECLSGCAAQKKIDASRNQENFYDPAADGKKEEISDVGK